MRTKAERIIKEWADKGYKLVGRTSGWVSYRLNSNMRQALNRISREYDVDYFNVGYETGAKKRRFSEGTEILFFLPENLKGVL